MSRRSRAVFHQTYMTSHRWKKKHLPWWPEHLDVVLMRSQNAYKRSVKEGHSERLSQSKSKCWLTGRVRLESSQASCRLISARKSPLLRIIIVYQSDRIPCCRRRSRADFEISDECDHSRMWLICINLSFRNSSMHLLGICYLVENDFIDTVVKATYSSVSYCRVNSCSYLSNYLLYTHITSLCDGKRTEWSC